MSEEHKVKAVLNIGGEIGSSLKGAFGLLTGNIFKIGTVADKAIKGKFKKNIFDSKVEVMKLTTAISKAGGATNEMGKALEKAEARLKFLSAANQSFYNLQSTIGKTARGFAVVTAEATATGWAIYHLTEKYDDYVMTAARGGEMLNITADQFAKLKYAAGDDIDTVSAGFKRFETNIQNGSKNTVKSLEAIGLSYDKLRKKSPMDAYLDYADAMVKYKGNKTAIAMNLQGKAGAASLPFLLRGSPKIKSRFDEAGRAGMGVDADAAAKALEYKESMVRLGGVIDGLKLSLGKTFLPIVEELGKTFSDFAMQHGPQIQAVLKDFGNTLKNNCPTAKEFKDDVKQIGDAFSFLKDDVWPVIEGLGGVKFVLGALIAMPFIPAAASLVTLGTALAGVEIAGAPLLLVGAALAGLGILVAANWGTVSAAFKPLGPQFDKLKKAWEPLIPIGERWGGIIGKLAGKLFMKELNLEISAMVSSLTVLADVLEKVVGWGGKAAAAIPGIAQSVGHAVLPTFVPGASGPSPAHANPGRKGFVPNQTNHVTIHVHGHPGMDANAVASLVMSRLGGLQAALAGGALYDG